MKKFFFTISSLLISSISFTQFLTQPLVHQSPEVSSLMRDVQAPVSLSSGTVNVNLPLYTVKHGDIEVPIFMNYDASGIKIDANPTWVGQNWNLNAGGMVSRVVKGIPDESYMEEKLDLMINGGNLNPFYYPAGYAYNCQELKNISWDNETLVKSKITGWATDASSYELEPDEFIFNFCGHSGKFYINEDGQVVCSDSRYKANIIIGLVPLYDARIAFNPNNPSSFTYYKDNMMYVSGNPIGGFARLSVSRIMGFCITDPDGIKYYFGMYRKCDENNLNIYTDYFREVEITADFFSQIFYEEFSAWYLESIVSPKGDVVNFEYSIGNPWASLSYNYVMNNMSGSASSGWWFGGGTVSASTYYSGSYYDGKFIRPVFLSKISTPNQNILFSRSNSTTLRYDFDAIHSYLYYHALDTYDNNLFIPVYDGQLPIIAYYIGNTKFLDYNLLKTSKLDEISIESLKKFKFQYNSNINKRLQLASITEFSNNKMIPYASFSYNTTLQLPVYLSTKKDHWGYFNNREANAYNSSYYNLREPVANYIQAEILNRITYPTGGYKEIIYEPNKYNRVVKRDVNSGSLSISSPSTEKIGGGLRVKEIINNDGTTSYTTKYTYDSGILNGEIQYYWGDYQGKLLNGNTYHAQRFFSSSLLPVSNNSEGGSVSYTKVTEFETGKGKIEYVFSNYNNTLDGNSISIDLQKSPYSPLSSKVVERGKLLEKTIYKENPTIPLERETYTYSIYNNNPIFLRAVNIKRLALFNSYQINAIEGSAYKIYMYPYNMVKKTEYINDGRTNSLIYSNDHQMTYDNYNQISSVLSNDNGINTKKEYKYPYNYSTSVYSGMKAKNIVSPVIEKITKIKNTVEIERVKTDYSEFNYYNNYFYAPSSIHTSYSGLNNLQLINTFNRYDSKGNIAHTTNKDGISTVYLWSYNGRYPVAEIKNASYSDVLAQIQGGQTTIDNITSKQIMSDNDFNVVNSLRTKLPNAMITTFTYKPFVGLTSTTDPNGLSTYYEYDDFGRLIDVKVGEINSSGTETKRKIQNYDYHYKNQ